MNHDPATAVTCPGCQQRDQRIAELQQRVHELEHQLDELRSQLQSAQQAGKRQAAPFRRSQPVVNPKKPGRPKGHPRAFRPPPAKVDRIIDVPCEACPDCHKPLTDKVVHVQIQTDLPPVVPIVTQFNVHGGNCPGCHRYHQGRHPEMISDATGAASNQIGPVALSMAAELKHRLGVPYRKIADFFVSYFDLKVAASTLTRAEQRLTAKAMPTFELLQEVLRAAGIVHADETGWRIGRLNAWLWVFTCERGTIYAIRRSRGHDVPEEILGADFDGILVVDGWSAYDVLDCVKGRCNGHILRRCHDLLEAGLDASDAALLRRLMAILREGLDLAERAAELSASAYEMQMRAWEDDFDDWLMVQAEQAGEEVQKVQKHILGHHDEFMRHLLNPGVPGTNNAAERQIRPAVVLRKTSGCNKTLRGALVHAVLASVMASIRQNGKRFLEFALALWHQQEAKPLDWSGQPIEEAAGSEEKKAGRGQRQQETAVGVASG